MQFIAFIIIFGVIVLYMSSAFYLQRNQASLFASLRWDGPKILPM